MGKLKQYKDSIWRVPLIAIIAGFLYTPLYVRMILWFGITESGVIDTRVSLLTNAGSLLAVLVLGGVTLLRKQSRKEIFVSSAVVSAYGLVLLLLQFIMGGTTGSMALVFMRLYQPLEWTGFFTEIFLYLKNNFGVSFLPICWLNCFVPFLFVLFGRKTVK